MMTKKQIIEMARSNALEAIDQKANWSADYTSFEAMHQNLIDTLVENGHANDPAAVDLADRIFFKLIRKHK